MRLKSLTVAALALASLLVVCTSAMAQGLGVLGGFGGGAIGTSTGGGGGGVSQVPELDPGAIGSAMALLSGGVLVLRSKLRRR
jgi:hypothetical protein